MYIPYFIYNRYGSPTITGNTISNNGSSGIYNRGSSSDYASPEISDNVISGNNGHGIYTGGYAAPAITGNEIYDNNGDGIYSYCESSVQYVISGNTIIDNNSSGIELSGYCDPQINSNNIYDNGYYDLMNYTYNEIDVRFNYWVKKNLKKIGKKNRDSDHFEGKKIGTATIFKYGGKKGTGYF